jgi:hypothetical protein
MFNKFFPKIVSFLDNVEKYARAGQVTDGNIIRRMRFACCITNVTNTSEYLLLIASPWQSDYVKVP